MGDGESMQAWVMGGNTGWWQKLKKSAWVALGSARSAPFTLPLAICSSSELFSTAVFRLLGEGVDLRVTL